MDRESSRTRFEGAILPHLSAAYNLARWLVRSEQEAQDLVQEACLRALTFFESFRGEDGRAWLLAIVRNTCYTWLRKNRAQQLETAFDEQTHGAAPESANPEAILLRKAGKASLKEALEALPAEYREILVLRELEGLSYKQIAGIADLPLGTVMSRLSRARKHLERRLAPGGAQ